MVTDFTFFISCISLHALFLKTNKMLKLNYNKIDHKTNLISGPNSDRFWYQGAIS